MRQAGRSKASSKKVKEAAPLPGFLKPFFWESALAQIHPRRHWFYIIERLIEYGDDRAIHWLKQHYSSEQIAEVVRTSRAISRNTANLWALILKIPRGTIRCFSEPSLLPHGAFSRDSLNSRIPFLWKKSGCREGHGGKQVNINEDQAKFLKDELFTLTFQGTMQRAHVYAPRADSSARSKFQSALQAQLKGLERRYKQAVSEEQHIKNIKNLRDSLKTRQVRFRIGHAQKALNLYLKYLWCLGEIPPPPHCPFDRWIIQDVLHLDMKWTCLDDIDEYRQLVKEARKQAKGLSLAAWELRKYSQT